jgi:L-threonylcarbamoyladenylate synthase
MLTQCRAADDDAIRDGARLLREGALVAFPTETVYGLGANALNRNAVLSIFKAKDRPCDNPLIVHIARQEDAEELCHVTDRATLLMRAFWPGPLTLLLKKKPYIPDIVTAGLDSVAVRMPSHPVAAALILAGGVPVAAPSANRSGRPSPTTAQHVMQDLNGRIPLILDGGPSNVGVESTVLDLTAGVPRILRPGGITREQIAGMIGNTEVDSAVMRPLDPDEPALSPGMRHRHYAPRGHLTLVKGSREAAAATIRALYAAQTNACVIAHTDNLPLYNGLRVVDMGRDASTAAHNLFAILRQLDDLAVAHIFAESLPEDGMGLAVMNRLARAAAFDIVEAGP